MNTIQANILKNAAILFAAIGLITMLVQWIAAPDYKAENTAVLTAITGDDQKILPLQLDEMIRAGKMVEFAVVDLRESQEFNRGTLPGAINIPFGTLLEKSSLRQIKKSGKPVILFSGDEAEAAAASLLLISKGFDDVQVIANDYTYIKNNVVEKFQPASAFNQSEKARYDYQRFFRSGGGAEAAPARTQPKIIQTEIVKTKGGC